MSCRSVATSSDVRATTWDCEKTCMMPVLQVVDNSHLLLT